MGETKPCVFHLMQNGRILVSIESDTELRITECHLVGLNFSPPNVFVMRQTGDAGPVLQLSAN